MIEEKWMPDDEMSEQEISAREERRLEMEKGFSYDGYLVIRKELYANLRDPAVTVRNGSITFNAACIADFVGAVYVRLYFNEKLGRMAVRKASENDKDALRWCIVKGEKRKSRKVSCPDLTDLIYSVMKWDKTCRYKILGYLIEVDNEKLFVFDFTVQRVYHERPPKGDAGCDQPIDRKGFYPDDVANTFGVPVEEYVKQNEVIKEDSYINVAMLTGPRKNSLQLSVDNKGASEQISSGEITPLYQQTILKTAEGGE